MQPDGRIVSSAAVIPQEITDELNHLRRLAAAVRVMRKSQAEFFKLRSGANLTQAKKAESTTDALLSEYDKLKARRPGQARQAGLL